MDIIVSHLNADFDAFASMVAAKKLYPEAELVFPGSQEKKVRDFIEYFHPVQIKRIKEIDLEKVKRLIVVDTKSLDRLGPLAVLVDKPGVIIHIYDHHPRSEGDIKASVEAIEDVGATATLMAEILMRRKLHPTPMESTIMSLGIHEETGNLLFPTTTERDLKALAYLLKHGASTAIVSNYMKPELSIEELDLLNELLRASRELVTGGVRVVISKASRESYIGDAAHLAHRMMDMIDTDAVVLMLRMDDKVLMVGRSRVPEFNIADVLTEFGGGGHPTAASATVKEIPFEILEEKLTALIYKAIRPEKTARDVMTRHVITINAGSTIKEAETMLTKYGVNVLPVVKEDEYKGILSREVVEKALFHGFGKNMAIEFATTDAYTAEKDTPLRDIEARMVEQNQRFTPVLENGHAVGAITRTDILRVMYEDYLRRSRISEPSAGGKRATTKNLASWLNNRFPEEIFETLKLAGSTAEETGSSAYLVGGSVRDVLRGEKNLDIDIVIEGDGVAFAKEFSARLGGKISIHERFQTAKITKGKLKLDIATARTEYYESPAALPTVETSSIKKDLYRRDFTINTLAIKLNPQEFGTLVDFFGGQRDLKEKTIRVLHNLSFIEDPTRAFRALRFAERFGFRLSKHTENLIKSTVKMSLFDKLSGSRLYEELLLSFGEADPVKVIKRFSEHNLLDIIHPGISHTDELLSLLSSIHDTLLWAGLSFMEEKPDKGTLYLLGLISGLEDKEKETTLSRLSVPEKKRSLFITNIQEAKKITRVLPLKDPAAQYDALHTHALETLLLSMALSDKQEVKKEISKFLLELRKVKPALTGNDLREMGFEPGPVYSKILGELLKEKLKGRLKTKEEEEAFVKQISPIV